MVRQFMVRPCKLVTQKIGVDAGTLPYAINCAQDGDTVLFSADIAGDTIVLPDSILIDKNLTILNSHASPVIIDASGVTNPITIAAGKQVNLKNLTIIAGTGDQAGSIVNSGELTLEKIIILDELTIPDTGTCILNQNVLHVMDSVYLISVFSDDIPFDLAYKSDNGALHIDSLSNMFVEMNFVQLNGSQLHMLGDLVVRGDFGSDQGSTLITGDSAVFIVQGNTISLPLSSGVDNKSGSEEEKRSTLNNRNATRTEEDVILKE